MDNEKMNNKGKGRRDFLRKLAVLPVAGVCLQADEARAVSRRREYVKLIDTTKCIGCHRCTSACNRWNDLPAERTKVLTGKTFTVVNYRPLASNGDRGVHVKWQCQHCRQPACARVCPVTAISKLPEGPVVIDEKKCIGCRYCYQACPFTVPELDFDHRVTRKCHLCYNRFTGREYRGKKYGGRAQPACVSNCPAGALDFGERSVMLKKAQARTNEIDGYLYGLNEAGGTDVLTILPAKPEELGMIIAPKQKLLEKMDSFRITMGGIAFAATMSGLMYFYSIMTESEDDDDDENNK